MNLLMISGERGIPAGRGGAFWNTLDLLRKDFDRIDVICPRCDSLQPVLQPFPNVFFHPSPWPLLLQPRWIVRAGRELIAVHGHSVMTVHEYPPFLHGLGARRLSRTTSVPYALEFHHGEPVRLSWRGRLERLWMRLFVASDARGATLVRAVNVAAGETLIRWGVPREKVKVVSSLYLDLSVFKPDPSIAKRFDIAFCSRLVQGKGFLELIEALKAMPKVTLLVIGDGPMRSNFETLVAAKGLSDRVTFTGWISSPTELAKTLQQARIFVMNSWSEGNPRTAVEALACGLPVIATKVGVMPELIEDGKNGILVSTDKRELVSAMEKMLKDSATRDVATLNYERFERGKAVRRYAELLQSLRSV